MDTGEIRGAVHAFLASGGRTSEPLLRSQASARTLAQHGRMPPPPHSHAVGSHHVRPAGGAPTQRAASAPERSQNHLHPFLHSNAPILAQQDEATMRDAIH
jgi:hypothetical protein